jgi:hypothetical protein
MLFISLAVFIITRSACALACCSYRLGRFGMGLPLVSVLTVVADIHTFVSIDIVRCYAVIRINGD